MAGTFEQARHIAHKMRLDIIEWAYIDNRDKIRGIRDGIVLAYGLWQSREDRVELMEMFRVREMTILYIND
ncbi:hypothetical protein [Caudoviricetes sp.]|nr:hypothetical protein [Caudoviricetes sp.]